MIILKEGIMEGNKQLLQNIFTVTAVALLLCSCVDSKPDKQSQQPTQLAVPEKHQRTVIEPSLLPQRFQRAGYMINDDEVNALLDSEASDEFQLKVGADITTHEPITLREAMKALVRNKKMSLSWASDVNQDFIVDIDVRADDNFYEAIDNILRQLDYFHEVQGSTLVIKYRETKQYHIAMPFNKQEYSTNVGSEGLSISSQGNKYDTWENIEQNIQTIIDTWSATITMPEPQVASTTKDDGNSDEEEVEETPTQLSRRVSSTESKYTIDRPLGIITVHAPRSLQKRIAHYLSRLEKEMYKQIIIEAKIIEVQLEDSSSLGINWNTLLSNFSIGNASLSGKSLYNRNIDDNIENENNRDNNIEDGTDTTTTNDNETTGDGTVTGILSNTLKVTTESATTLATILTGGAENAASAGVSLSGFSFTSFINALKEQGKTSILSNPKISVLNGQPALIEVGRDVTYIKKVTKEVDADAGTSNYNIETANVLSGVGLAITAVIKTDNEIVMNLVPITSELVGTIEYRTFGEAEVGLPVVNKREMNTTVKIKNGSMLVVGGLISETESSSGDSIYGTENIPYLKYLFGQEKKQKSKRELIILLRPRII
ncbi:MAG: hypothetical protein D3920_07120 [Candidatus Electrothrix sp. AW2]|nr:hypothetical protein [Candidatus Electrothrix gigas]MCI5195253.1 hypothetical protein [Candidatus Electrothrix gigas]